MGGLAAAVDREHEERDCGVEDRSKVELNQKALKLNRQALELNRQAVAWNPETAEVNWETVEMKRVRKRKEKGISREGKEVK